MMKRYIFIVFVIFYYMPISIANDCNNFFSELSITRIIHCSYLTSFGQYFGNSPANRDCSQDSSPFWIRPSLTDSFKERGANCSNFIQENGSYGPWGEIVEEYITNSNDKSYFLSNEITDIAQVCPRWDTLNNEQKINFWVWTFAAIAHDESTCRENVRNPNGTNTIAVGLLQMEELRSKRAWRGINCMVPAVEKARENLRCGLDIMADLLKGPAGQYQSTGAIYREPTAPRVNSYWEKLRRHDGGGIGRLIREYPLCGN